MPLTGSLSLRIIFEMMPALDTFSTVSIFKTMHQSVPKSFCE